MAIYTRTGDDGTTGLQGNRRISKSSARVAAYGTVDEASAAIGVALAECADGGIRSTLTTVQNELFELGAELSGPGAGPPRVTDGMVEAMEGEIDSYEAGLAPLANFILPGGTRLSAAVHAARTVARRAEIRAVELHECDGINPNCIRYLNRLSDLLFVVARTANARGGVADTAWAGGGGG